MTETDLTLAQHRPRRVVVGFSGGVTSAWCAGWALRTFPREEVVLLWHDTKEEDPDTYRFLGEMAAALGMPMSPSLHPWTDIHGLAYSQGTSRSGALDRPVQCPGPDGCQYA